MPTFLLILPINEGTALYCLCTEDNVFSGTVRHSHARTHNATGTATGRYLDTLHIGASCI